jgi:NADH:ubiquinone oxidoreductase subunit 6 (subunit J)
MLFSLSLTLLPLAMLSSSVLVVTAASPVVSVLFMVALFMLSAVYMVLAGLPFAGLVYLVVYVGAVAVLFLFVVMLLNVPLSVYGGSEQAVPLQVLLVSLFLLVYVLSGSDGLRTLSALSQSPDTLTSSLNQAQSLASDLFTHDALLLVLVGLVLLLAMVGPVSMSMSHDAEGLRHLQAQAASLASRKQA